MTKTARAQYTLEFKQEAVRLIQAGVPALVRAPLLHFYFELIHPFWDGNRRVGRVIAAAVLHTAGDCYAPFAMARDYRRRDLGFL